MGKIFTFAKTNLTNSSHILAMQDFRKRLDKITISHPSAAQLLATFAAAVQKEDDDCKADLGSSITPEIKDADNQRDRAWGVIMSMAYSFEGGVGSPEQTAAAKALISIRKKFGVSTTAGLAEETGKLNQAIEDIEQKHIDFGLFGLADVFITLKQANKVCFDFVCERQNERADLEYGIMKTDRAATDAAYDALVDLIDAVALLFPTDQLLQFIKEWNSMINYYRVYVLHDGASAQTPGAGAQGTGEGGSSEQPEQQPSSPANPGNQGGSQGGDDTSLDT